MKEFIGKLVERQNLTQGEAEQAMKIIMGGEATQAQIAAFLTALRMKGETIEEIAACAKVMREFAERINPKVSGVLVDTCGTGGDKIKTFNISTLAAFVAAGAGVAIAKHGNRSVTSRSGSADVLEAIGVKIDCSPEQVQRCIERVGIGFMFAPVFHKAMRHVALSRKEIGVRTIFNILGPLTNPAGAKAQVLGVFDASLTEKMASVLGNLGSERAVVVHGLDGLDEISTLGITQISELRDSKVKTYKAKPEGFGLKRASIGDLLGGDANFNARIAIDILKNGAKGAKRDIVVLNAAAAICVAGKATTIKEAIPIAEEVISSGKAYEKLAALVKESGGDTAKLEALSR